MISGIPPEISRYVATYVATSLSPALLSVDRHGRVLSFAGAAELYGLSDLRTGQLATTAAYFLEGLLPAGESPITLVHIETISGVFADVHLFSHSGVDYVLLLDATREVNHRHRIEQALRSAEEQLRHAEKMNAIGRLAGGIAHDFNNLLTVILGYHDLLTVEVGDNTALQTAAQEIGKAAERAASLTGRLLAFSRKQLLTPVVLNLNTVVREIRAALEKMIGEDVALAISLDSQLGHAEVDRGQLEQVILNLIANARDAMPTGGRLIIETRNVTERRGSAVTAERDQASQWVVLSVSDTGCGMDQETLAHAFEPFFTTKGHKGTGLGLASVQGTVTQSGGHIKVHSQPARGTRFELFFPRVYNSPADSSSVEAEYIHTGGGETLLVVDDEPLLRTLLDRLLTQSGYTVLVAEDADEAVQLCDQHTGPIDLLLTDVVMPRIGGPELGRILTAMRPSIRVLYMSGYAENAIAHRKVDYDACIRLLKKPFTADTLTRRVREALSEAVTQGKDGAPLTSITKT